MHAMRILWISHFLPFPPDAGAPKRNLGLLRELSRSHEVDLLTFAQPQTHPPGPKRDRAVEALREWCRSVTVVELPSAGSSLQRARSIVKHGLRRLGSSPMASAGINGTTTHRSRSRNRLDWRTTRRG